MSTKISEIKSVKLFEIIENLNAPEDGTQTLFKVDLPDTSKATYQKFIMSLLTRKKFRSDELKQFLLMLPKSIVPNMENPLFLADFLTSCLDHENDLELQILGLRDIFILLEKHGLDYPNYYRRLYGMLMPQYQPKTYRTISVFTIERTEKVRFLRLLDLSLRSPKIPSRVIAAFLKRLARLVMSHVVC